MKFYIYELSNPDEAIPFPKDLDNRWDRFTVQQLAKFYHDNFDGWELQSWPYIFVILSDNGNEIARYCVEREFDPEFYAAEIPRGR